MILPYKNIPIYYVDEGKGDTAILLHGFLENSTMWNDLIPSISKSKRVLAVDLLGHGQTGCLGYIHTMEQMAEAINYVMEYLNIDKASFIGHSMGGYVALAFTEQFHNKVTGLCLMNSTALPDTEEKQINRDRAIMAVKQNYQTFIKMSVSNLFAEHNRDRLKEKIELVKEEALKTPIQGIVAALEGMKIRKNREEILSNTSCKKMMIIGCKDPVLDFVSLVNQIEDSDVEKITFSDGHMSHIENKEELVYNLLRFIEK